MDWYLVDWNEKMIGSVNLSDVPEQCDLSSEEFTEKYKGNPMLVNEDLLDSEYVYYDCETIISFAKDNKLTWRSEQK